MTPRRFIIPLLLAAFFLAAPDLAHAQTRRPSPSPSPSAEATASAQIEPSPSPEPTATPTPRPDITQTTQETKGPLEELLDSQNPGSPLLNPLKHAIRRAASQGVPPNTIVLLLLLPVMATIIATARHFIGLRGFGIFLPAALSVVFLATGPVLGIVLFLIIVMFSTLLRMFLRKTRVKLQYLPRMAFILWFSVIGVLFLLFTAPFLNIPGLANVSIFPVLILVLLAEDFTKVQLGKSARTAISFAVESIILSLATFFIVTLDGTQRFALLNPEITLISVAAADFLLGKYTGLRVLEYWRFRKLILKG